MLQPRKKKAPRFTADNTKDAAENLESLQAEGPILSQPCAESTAKDRERAFQFWKDFVQLTSPGSGLQDQVWVWLAGDDLREQENAMAYCRNFLTYFVKSSGKPWLVWGSEEQRKSQGITTVTALNSFWKSLVAAAQEQVLNRMAWETGCRLTLARCQGVVGALDQGPVAQVTQWLATCLRAQYGLTIDSQYQKTSATCKDMERMLHTLWERADDIPMPRISRITFHLYLLILYVSGCRPGMLEQIKWKDCQLYLLQDPNNPSRRRLFANVTLWFNKLRRKDMVRSDQDHFTFSTTRMPTPLLDLHRSSPSDLRNRWIEFNSAKPSKCMLMPIERDAIQKVLNMSQSEMADTLDKYLDKDQQVFLKRHASSADSNTLLCIPNITGQFVPQPIEAFNYTSFCITFHTDRYFDVGTVPWTKICADISLPGRVQHLITLAFGQDNLSYKLQHTSTPLFHIFPELDGIRRDWAGNMITASQSGQDDRKSTFKSPDHNDDIEFPPCLSLKDYEMMDEDEDEWDEWEEWEEWVDWSQLLGSSGQKRKASFSGEHLPPKKRLR